jgi:HAD superfamily hydrolase (TIGR01509 family)
MLAAALLDVGGTLWPERLAAREGEDPRLARLADLLPSVDITWAFAALQAALRGIEDGRPQATHGLIDEALSELGLAPGSVDARDIRRALCEPAISSIRLFPGAPELLAEIRELGLRCVLVSNAAVRGEDEYWRDFADFGIADLVDSVVSSVDVGVRKPHPAIFEAALQAAGGPDPRACVMVGNSEANDIRPAIGLGMRAIRVAIEELPPEHTAAHALATKLTDVATVIRAWASAADHGDQGREPPQYTIS